MCVYVCVSVCVCVCAVFICLIPSQHSLTSVTAYVICNTSIKHLHTTFELKVDFNIRLGRMGMTSCTAVNV